MVSFVAFTFLIHLECIYVLGLFLAPLPQNDGCCLATFTGVGVQLLLRREAEWGGGTAAPELTATLERCLVTPFRTT